MRRVVVTGIGAVTSLGYNVKNTWNNLINSKSGIKKISRFNTDGVPESISKVAAEINLDVSTENAFDPTMFVEKKDVKKMDQFIWFGMAAAEEAINDADWKTKDEKELERTGVIAGAGIGGLTSIQNTSIETKEKGIKRISPFFIPQSLINLLPGQIAIKYGYSNINFSIVSACAGGNHIIGEAAEIIKRNAADVVIAGAGESAICEIGIGGFSAMHALSTNFNNFPEKASRPWDKDRDGFVMGEGAAMLVLEEYEHAKKRGAKVYCELVGYGVSCDAFHVTMPHTECKGSKKCMQLALKNANLSADNIQYINAHGTSTPAGDLLEFKAVKEIFNSNLNNLHMSSTKSATGHLLGAAGAIEAVISIEALQNNILPPTLNLDNIDENCIGIDLVPNKAKESKINYVLSNSFGFGGTNASLIFKKI